MNKGYSVIELLIVVATLAISLTIAVPAFSQLTQSIESDAVTKKWISTLNFARQYAHTNSVNVIVCPVLNNRCNTNLSGVWSVFTDANNNQVIDGQDTLLQVHTLKSNELVNFYGQSQRFFRFQSSESGIFNGHMRGFSMCPSGYPDKTARHLTTNIMGRVSFRETRLINDVAHIYKSAGWVPIECR